jgi:TonB family protein
MTAIRSFCVRFLVLVSLIALSFDCAHSAQRQPDPYGVYEVGGGVMPPEPVYMPNPKYTDKARKMKLNGSVTVAVIVTPEGTVRDPKVIKSLDKDLDKQALAVVSTWKFEPAKKDGKTVAVHLKVEVDFRLY